MDNFYGYCQAAGPKKCEWAVTEQDISFRGFEEFVTLEDRLL
jgi:hypothetical protein